MSAMDCFGKEDFYISLQLLWQVLQLSRLLGQNLSKNVVKAFSLGWEIFITGSMALFLVREDESMMVGMEKSPRNCHFENCLIFLD